MDNLILSKSHRFDHEIKIIKTVSNDIILYSKKRTLSVSFDEDNIIMCSKKSNKKDCCCIKMLDENFKKTAI